MFKRWLRKKKLSNSTTAAGQSSTATTGVGASGASVVNTVTTVGTGYTTYAIPQSYNYGNITIAGNGAAGAGYAAGTINVPSPTFTFTMSPATNIITLSNNGQEIVRLNRDGTVTWANGIDIDAAAEAFGKSLTYSAELKAGITQGVKLRMRDSVFETLINIAKEKGPLSADDLTYLLESSKIIEKLKGGTNEF